MRENYLLLEVSRGARSCQKFLKLKNRENEACGEAHLKFFCSSTWNHPQNLDKLSYLNIFNQNCGKLQALAQFIGGLGVVPYAAIFFRICEHVLKQYFTPNKYAPDVLTHNLMDIGESIFSTWNRKKQYFIEFFMHLKSFSAHGESIFST